MEVAARRLWPTTDDFSLYGLLRQRVTAAFEDIDTKEAFKVRDGSVVACHSHLFFYGVAMSSSLNACFIHG